MLDLVIWTGPQLIFAVKLSRLHYQADNLAGMMGWTTKLDCVIRLLWPCLEPRYASALRNAFQKKALSLVDTFPTVDDIKECSICLEESRDLCRLPCNHCFHRHCIRTWFQSRPDSASRSPCAICRREASQLMASG